MLFTRSTAPPLAARTREQWCGRGTFLSVTALSSSPDYSSQLIRREPKRNAPDRTSTERDAVNLKVYLSQRSSPWRGFLADKCAQDLLVYQEIIAGVRPDIILETGSWYGGSGLFFADVCDLIGWGQVLSIDRANPQPYLPQHPRLTFLGGDSVAPEIIAQVHEWTAGATGLVILDSDHERSHVLAELEAYHDLVSLGSYLIVEDTNVNGHPVRSDFGPGPWEAVEEWLESHPEFVKDADSEPYVTFAPGGYLRRLK